MHILDKQRLTRAMKKRGIHSLHELSRAIGTHRNTLHHYLAGRDVFAKSISDVLSFLEVEPAEIIVKKSDHLLTEDQSFEKIAPAIDALHRAFPSTTFILFGSRARRTAGQYSDWDLGVYQKKGLDHKIYRSIRIAAQSLFEKTPYFVDVVNLNAAEPAFLREISKAWKFLTGSQTDWIDLERKSRARS